MTVQHRIAPENIIMLYLAAVALIASRFGFAVSAVAAITSVAAFDYFFVPPHLSFAVADAQYLLTFVVMLSVALLISGLSQRLRNQARASEEREQHAAVVYALRRDLAESDDAQEVAQIGVNEISQVFDAPASITFGDGHSLCSEEPRREAETSSTTVQLSGSRGLIGLVAVHRQLDQQEQLLLGSLANGLAVAIERSELARESRQARLDAETERARNVLLNSVSHDLRTPLTVIQGAASAIAESRGEATALAQEIVNEATRLDRHIQNLLDITRIESSSLHPQLEWHSIEEVVGSAVARCSTALQGRPVRTYIPPSMALVRVDEILVGKALVNLLENAARYTPAGTDIEVRVSMPTGNLRIQVLDHGPGVPSGEEQRIFDKFYRLPSSRVDRGSGLGLAICKAVAAAHGGSAWMENRPGGGARFVLELPTGGVAPEVPSG